MSDNLDKDPPCKTCILMATCNASFYCRDYDPKTDIVPKRVLFCSTLHDTWFDTYYLNPYLWKIREFFTEVQNGNAL